VKQIVTVVQDVRQKNQLLQDILKKEGQGALVIIFCGTKKMCDQLERYYSQLRCLLKS
jgi:superfamily II DNA/RNA helicase